MILAVWNRSSFRLEDYRWYWMGNVLVHITYLLQAVALAWHMLEITDSPAQVGLVAFFYGMPLLFVSPFSGLLADKFKRQWMIQTALYIAVGTSALLALLAAIGLATPPLILIASFTLGLTFTLYAPARLAVLPNLVPEAMIFNATTLSYSGTRLMGFFGPVLAGFLLEWTDIAATLFVQSMLFAVGAGLYLKATHFLPKPLYKREPGASVLAGFREIGVFIRRNRALLALLLLSLVFVPLGMPYQKLMPIFVDEVLREGPGILGLLVGCASLGSALSGFGIVAVGDTYAKGPAILLFSLAFGVCLALFAFITDPSLAIVVIFITGVFSGMFLTNINVLLLTIIPDNLRGRMMSLWGMVWGLIPVTTLIGGTVAEYHSIVLVLAVSGAAVAATCAFMLLSRSPLLDL